MARSIDTLIECNAFIAIATGNGLVSAQVNILRQVFHRSIAHHKVRAARMVARHRNIVIDRAQAAAMRVLIALMILRQPQIESVPFASVPRIQFRKREPNC